MNPLPLAGLLGLLAAPPPAPEAGLFPAQLVADLESQTAPPLSYSWLPLEIVEGSGGLFYFFEDDGVHGRELWRSDGTALGTYLLRDICPGQCAALPLWRGSAMAAQGSHLYFAADDGVHGLELWVTDGTALGTWMVRDVREGSRGSNPYLFVRFSGQVFFVADDGAHGDEVWRTDGTAAGTRLFGEIVPGPEAAGIAAIIPGSGFLYVGVDSGIPERAGLWRMDGSSPTGERLCPGRMQTNAFKGAPYALLPDGRLLFQGDAGADGEPWVSDGSVGGTFRLADLSAGPAGSYPNAFTRAGGLVYFAAQASVVPGRFTGLWRSDGSPSGTVEIPLPSEVGFGGMNTNTSMEGVGDRLFFAASDPDHGLEPWILDETGPHRIRDVAPGAASSLATDLYSSDRLYAAASGRYLFVANDGIDGPELWASDGTEVGTTRVSAIAAGGGSLGIPYQAAYAPRRVVGGRMAFIRWSASTGRELWWSDGTVGGTARVQSVNRETSAFHLARTTAFFDLPGIHCAAATGSRLVFAAESASRATTRVFGTDGTAVGTQPLATLVDGGAGVSSPGCISTGSTVLFYALEGTEASLHATTGEPSGTLSLAVVGAPDSLTPSDPPFVAVGGRWVGSTDTHWLETDLTPPGTAVTATTNLALSLAVSGAQLWGLSYAGVLTGDGTPAGMQLVPAGDGQPFDYPFDLALVGGLPLFVSYRAASGLEPWRSDGSATGTVLLADLAPGEASAFDFVPWIIDTAGRQRQVQSLDTLAVMAVDDGVHGTELWRTDGTPSGTVLVKDIYPGSYASTPRDLVRVGDVVYFAAEDELHGLELWVTDGTSDGTRLVRDLVPGADSSVPQELTEVRERLYFTAWRPAWGREAFQTDGTEAGTVQVSDVWPGTGSSSPSRFAAVRDTLYFAANDGEHGFELFKVSDATLLDLFADGFEGGALDAWSRRTGP